MPAATTILAANFEGKNTIVTSTITFCEVVERVDSVREAEFLRLFDSVNHSSYDVDFRIAEKARKIRTHFHHADPKQKIATPDAIHLATALITESEEFHTNDMGQKADGTPGKSVSLLGLNKWKFEGREISVCQPWLPQGILNF